MMKSFNNLPVAIAGTFITASTFAIVYPVQALTLVSDRSSLGANDSLDFGSLGKRFNPFAPPTPDSFLPNNFSATSTNGLELNFEIPPSNDPAISPPFIFQTGFPPTGIPTNFADGDFLLFTGADFRTFPAPGNSNPITIDFATPVIGAGTQIAVDDTLSFTANVSAFDNEGNLLDSFSLPGTSSLALDNSALFLGVVSEEANIARLVYSSSVPNRAIAINTLSISNETKIPESSSLLGLLIVTTSSIFYFASKSRSLPD
jgi:hypothetical protein